MIDRSRGGGYLAGPSVSGIARRETLGVRASARKEELFYSGIGKFRCETKEGKGRGAGDGRISTTSMRKRDEVHQACGSGFVRPPLCLSFSDLRRVRSSYFYRLWQFPRTL